MNKQVKREPSIFCAGFVLTKIGGEWYSFCVRKVGQSDLKAAGGTSDPGEDLNDPIKILIRELIEELSIEVIRAVLVHKEEYPETNHTKYFYLVIKHSALPGLGFQRIFQVKENGVVTEELEVKIYPLREFANRLFFGQRAAFAKVLELLAKIEQEFPKKYSDLLERFPVS